MLISFFSVDKIGEQTHKYAVIRYCGDLSEGSYKNEEKKEYYTDYQMIDFDDMRKKDLINVFSVGNVESLSQGEDTELTEKDLDEMILKAKPEFIKSSYGVSEKPCFRKVLNAIRKKHGDDEIKNIDWLQMQSGNNYKVRFLVEPEEGVNNTGKMFESKAKAYEKTANEFFEKVNQCLGVDYLKVDLSEYIKESQKIDAFVAKQAEADNGSNTDSSMSMSYGVIEVEALFKD